MMKPQFYDDFSNISQHYPALLTLYSLSLKTASKKFIILLKLLKKLLQ